MESFFDREFLALERELQLLKTSAQRSSGTVETVSSTLPVSVPLSISGSGNSCSGSRTYIIKPESESVLNITLDWYHENVMEEWRVARISRSARVRTVELPNGDLGVNVVVTGTNWSENDNDDLSRLRRGESVSVNVNLTIQSTNNFEVEAN